MKDPIFILGAHKSGTSLLRALFDGHEKLFAIPIETHFAKHLGWWTKYPLNAQTVQSERSTQHFIEYAMKWVEESNTVDDRYGDGRAKGIFDEAVFEKLIHEIDEEDSQASVIKKYFLALYTSINGTKPGGNVTLVEKSVENCEHAMMLKHIFPQSKFIHILRNPYSNLVTLRKYMQKLHPSYPHLDKLIKSVSDSFYYASKNVELIEDYRVIRYEDIVSETENVMKNLAQFLGVDFIESLLQPSYLGKAWSGNSVSDSSFKTVSTERLDPWKREINTLEIQTVNTFLGDAVVANGYSFLPAEGGTLWPMRRERVKEYIANRVNLKRPF